MKKLIVNGDIGNMIEDNNNSTPEQKEHHKRMVVWNEYWKEQDKSLWYKERRIGLGSVVNNVPKLYALKPNVKPSKFIHDAIRLFETKSTAKILFAIRPPMAGDKAGKYIDLWVTAHDVDDFQSKLRVWMDCTAELTGTIGPQLA